MKRAYTVFFAGLLFAVVFSCATIKPVIQSVDNPDGAVGDLIADCAKPEIADQVSNALAGINAIILDPNKIDDVKAQEIAALKAAGQEVLACALRDGIGDITSMIRNAANKHASIDPRIVKGQDLMARVIHEQSFTYKDGWSASQ